MTMNEANREIERDALFVTLDAQGDFLQVKPSYPYKTRNVRGLAKRGVVAGFSAASRLRMMRLVSTLDTEYYEKHHPLFITLTYAKNQTDHDEAQRDLQAFVKRVIRLAEDAAFIWKKETQQRGAIHFHIVLFNVVFIDKDWISRAWGEITGDADASGRSPFTRVERLAKGKRGALSYITKYISKGTAANEEKPDDSGSLGLTTTHISPTQEKPSTGRWWGVVNRSKLKFAERKVVLCTMSYEEYRALVASYFGEADGALLGFKVFADNANKVAIEIREACEKYAEYDKRLAIIKDAMLQRSEYYEEQRAMLAAGRRRVLKFWLDQPDEKVNSLLRGCDNTCKIVVDHDFRRVYEREGVWL